MWQAGSSPYPEDGLGSVVAVSNWQGVPLETYKYDAFGNTTIMNGSGGARSSGSIILGSRVYGFTGREYETNTGLYYYRARYYNPAIGRFLQPDPIGYADSLNLYQYCGNNPVNWIDPWGEMDYGGSPYIDNTGGGVGVGDMGEPNPGEVSVTVDPGDGSVWITDPRPEEFDTDAAGYNVPAWQPGDVPRESDSDSSEPKSDKECPKWQRPQEPKWWERYRDWLDPRGGNPFLMTPTVPSQYW